MKKQSAEEQKRVAEEKLAGYQHLLECWSSSEPLNAQEIMTLCANNASMRSAVSNMAHTSFAVLTVAGLGRALRAFRGKVCNGRALRSKGLGHPGLVYWEVVTVGQQDEVVAGESRQHAGRSSKKYSMFDARKEFLQSWSFSKPVTTGQILARCKVDPHLAEMVLKLVGVASMDVLDANLLLRECWLLKDKVCDGLKLRLADRLGGVERWEVVSEVLRPVVDSRLVGYKAVLRVWPFTAPVTAAGMINHGAFSAAFRLAVTEMVGAKTFTHLTPQRLGRALRSFLGKIHDGKQLRSADRTSDGVTIWEVVAVNQQPQPSPIKQKSFPNDKGRIVNYVSIAERVTQDDAKEALWRVWCQLFSSFPFEGMKASQDPAQCKSRWEQSLQSPDAYVPVAAILTVLLRDRIAGPIPGFVFNSSMPGTGKTLIMNLVSLVSTGRSAISTPLPVQQAEFGQLISFLAASQVPVAVFDGVIENTVIGDSVLESVLSTADVYVRKLGRNELFRAPWHTVLLFAGNNVRSTEDCYKRMLFCRLNFSSEQPNNDQFEFYAGHSHKTATKFRDLILWDLYTIVRAWENATQKPDAGPCGMYESWAGMIPSMIMYAGGPNVLQALNRKVAT